jgi:hypothetical protein
MAERTELSHNYVSHAKLWMFHSPGGEIYAN